MRLDPKLPILANRGRGFLFNDDGVQPTVAKDVVYWPDGNGTLWALKEKTGVTLWSTSNWGQFCSPVNGANGSESQPQVVMASYS